jgi:hypothetical protein
MIRESCRTFISVEGMKSLKTRSVTAIIETLNVDYPMTSNKN